LLGDFVFHFLLAFIIILIINWIGQNLLLYNVKVDKLRTALVVVAQSLVIAILFTWFL
jgi:hypothetical protein